jgi:hypothetical protein
VYCRKCGHYLKEGELFCLSCGALLPDQLPVDAGPSEVPESFIPHPDTVLSQENLPTTVHDTNSAPLQKPLYGYEDYDPNVYDRMQAQQQPSPVVQATPQYHPVNSPYTSLTGVQATEKPKRNRIGLLIILISSMFAILLICLLIIIGLLKDIRRNTSAYEDHLFNNYQKENYADRYDWQEDGEGEGSHATYDWLINDYFDLVAKGDNNAIVELLHPRVIEALQQHGYKETEFAEAVDAYIEYYGCFVEQFSVIDVYPYSTSDYATLEEKIGFDQAALEAYVDIYVAATVKKDSQTINLWYDFDLVKIDGFWYLISVW